MEHGLDPALFCALVERERVVHLGGSVTNRHSRSATSTRSKAIDRFGSTSYRTERKDRATSWGLCQVMGQVARELGCKVRSLLELDQLCAPEVGLEYGRQAAQEGHGQQERRCPRRFTQLQRRVRQRTYPDRVLDKVKNYA